MVIEGEQVCQICMYHPWTRYFNHFLTISSSSVSCLYIIFLKLQTFTFSSYTSMWLISYFRKSSLLSMVFMVLILWFYLSTLCSARTLFLYWSLNFPPPCTIQIDSRNIAYIYVSFTFKYTSLSHMYILYLFQASFKMLALLEIFSYSYQLVKFN